MPSLYRVDNAMGIGSPTLNRLDAAWRLGPKAVLRAAWHRAPVARALARRSLPTGSPDAAHYAEWLSSAPPPAAPELLAEHRAAVLGHAGDGGAGHDWHGPFAAGPHALDLDLFAAGDVRPVWERNRLAELPLLAQAARLAPGAGHLARSQALLADWSGANPAFNGPNWACGQEAALRALHLGLALGLLDQAPTPTLRALLAQLGQRIAATPGYALAQDNNHPVSEAAGLFACGLLLAEPDWVRTGTARLATGVARLVAPCGGFAQVSTGYHRLLLDVLSIAEWLRRRHGAPAWPDRVRERAAAATVWLHRLTDPGTGRTPRLGHQDGSAFADLSLAGPDDARPSVERAARLFAGHGAGYPADPGCAWLGLPPPDGSLPPAPAHWAAAGSMGWHAGGARALLRSGPLRFRPGQADLLHLELWDGSLAVLRDGGTASYNPPPEHAWWHAHLTGTAAHNTVEFDGRDQMPRVGRFLFARWPRLGQLPGQGAWLRDHRGNRHARRLRVDGRRWIVEDRIAGPFAHAALRWRLSDGPWQATPDGVEGAAARLSVTGDGPLRITLEPGWASPGYNQVVPAPVLVARAVAPISRILTVITLP